MGSSGEPNTKNIDPSVGGLVWVRRRNGSWWPGRIMGLDELSESCLVSPRSGTPVKLLGREDASVDWYNLEKSKRVKAFRCGEYDECIEKAKASAANSSKKAVKYARREDAILHALEIESARLSNDHLDFCSRMDNARGEESEDHGDCGRESPIMSHSSTENEDMADEGKRWKTPNDSEDDGTEGIKRMRGLEDLGMGVGMKRKDQAEGALDLVQQGTTLYDSNTANSFSVGSPLNGSKSYFLPSKRKRSQVAHVHDFLKRKNRRRQLTKVLESTAMVSVPVMCDELVSPCRSPLQGVSDSKVSGLESNESKRSFSMVVNNSSESTGISCENGATLNTTEPGYDASNGHYKHKENEISSTSELPENDGSDTLFDVPFVGEGKNSAGAGLPPMYVPSSSAKPQGDAVGRQYCQSSQTEMVSLKNEEPNESGSTSSAAARINNVSQRIEKGTSKWQLKGKRNSRHFSKKKKQDSRKSVEMDNKSSAYLAGIELRDGLSLGSDQRVDSHTVARPFSSDSCILQKRSREVREDMVDGLQYWSKHISCIEPQVRGLTAEVKLMPSCSPTPQRSLPYRQSRYTVHPKYQTTDFSIRNFCADSSLYDVNLEVKASYRPQHVPLVSLMSKLNGKAIVGHPLTVEMLADGCGDLLLGNKCHMASGSRGLKNVFSIGLANREGDAGKRNPEVGKIPSKHLSMQTHFSPSKSPKLRKCGLVSKKTRKLSSLTGSQVQRKEESKCLIEKPKGAAIACIPLKVVFSRINEAVNGSTRPMQQTLTSSDL
ncbi:uncharacterized protein At1g51745 isoform X2 [Malania oleifera]|uniref:uncharacterized protein At1g51745 isoform X2 n=1 Tax=Malania oleifera TaxID=397392 RepID=UPI0025AE34D8|nr:uncharacterized protein At1g51745 isoform X2 [Malania oleifera]